MSIYLFFKEQKVFEFLIIFTIAIITIIYIMNKINIRNIKPMVNLHLDPFVRSLYRSNWIFNKDINKFQIFNNKKISYYDSIIIYADSMVNNRFIIIGNIENYGQFNFYLAEFILPINNRSREKLYHKAYLSRRDKVARFDNRKKYSRILTFLKINMFFIKDYKYYIPIMVIKADEFRQLLEKEIKWN